MSPGPLPAWMAPVTVPASWCYGAGVRLRNAWHDRRQPRSVPVPVVSVGNLVVGGSGKSPMVRWVAQRLSEAGRRPAVALRGYRRSESPHLPDGDEAAEHGLLLPRVPLAVGADRVAAIVRLLDSGTAVDVVVLDDGFQHRRIARDLDLVLVDATRPAFASRLLPAGWLREPPSALSRADAVVVTRAAAVDAGLAARIESFHGRPPVAWCEHELEEVLVRTEAGEARHPPAWLAGRHLGMASAIARPDAFERSLQQAGARVTVLRALRDHASFSAADVESTTAAARAAGVDAVACTMKDWVKLAPLAPGLGVPVAVPRVGLRMVAGGAALTELVVSAAARPLH